MKSLGWMIDGKTLYRCDRTKCKECYSSCSVTSDPEFAIKHDMTFAETLTHYMKYSGKQKEDIAEEIGVSKSSLTSYIQGTFPKINIAYKLAAMMDMSIEELWGKELGI